MTFSWLSLQEPFAIWWYQQCGTAVALSGPGVACHVTMLSSLINHRQDLKRRAKRWDGTAHLTHFDVGTVAAALPISCLTPKVVLYSPSEIAHRFRLHQFIEDREGPSICIELLALPLVALDVRSNSNDHGRSQ